MGLPAESQPTEDERLSRIKRESFALGAAVMRAERLVTHETPDIDALLSVALAQLYRRFQGARVDLPISFVSGGCKDFKEGVLALDIGVARGLRSTSSGGLMLKASEAGGSACMAVARLLREDDFNIIKPLVEEVSINDESGEGGTIDRFWNRHRLWKYAHGEKPSLIVTSIFDMFQSLRYTSHDFELYELFVRWIEGMIIRGHKRNFSRQRNPWDGVEIYYNGRLAILPIGASIYQAKALEEQGVEVSLYTIPMRSLRDGWSMAIHRSSKSSMDFTKLFRGKVNDFLSAGIFVSEYYVGWGGKGNVYRGSEAELRIMRDLFIQRVKDILGPWYALPEH